MGSKDNFFDDIVKDEKNTIEELASNGKNKGGRPRRTSLKQNKSVTTYLTEEEKDLFKHRLKGIPESVWIRSKILEFIDK